MNLQLDTMLHAKRTHRKMDSRKVRNNTYLRRLDTPGAYALKLHNTDVATYHPDKSITLNSGGWRTSTTKDRINVALDYMDATTRMQVYQEKGEWYVRRWNGQPDMRYFDGMRIDRDGHVMNPEDGPDFEAEDARNKDMLKRINKFLKTLTPERFREIYQHALEHGTAGDCWFCSMDWGDPSHLESHLDEDYHMASTWLRALEWKGYRHPTVIIQMDDYRAERGEQPDLTKRALRSYLKHHLIKNRATR